MNSIRQFIFAIMSLFALSHARAQVAAELRLWEGTMRADTNLASHHNFIANVLAPGTVTAGLGALESYVVYIPRAGALPEDSFAPTLSFTEAAIPLYTNNASYLASRAAHPEYGPLHFIENGFQPTVSYSASPVVFNGEVRIATPDDKVAYDLRAYSRLPALPTLGGEALYAPVDWQAGNTIVWLQLRKAGSSDADYRATAARLFRQFTDLRVSGDIDGHYAKVSAGHILHFINVPDSASVEAVYAELQSLQAEQFNATLMSLEMLKAKKLAPFAAGWTAAFTSSSAVNVVFPGPGRFR